MTTPDFDDIADAFAGAGNSPDAHPAELHGLACGFLAAGFQPAPEQWREQVADYLDLPAEGLLGSDALSSLLSGSYDSLVSGDFEFQLCLPDDDLYGLGERSESLARWCQGFLHGFGTVQVPLGDETRELLADLAEISRLEMTGEDDDTGSVDENEGYYAELTEFVRMAVIGLFMDYSRSLDAGGNHVQH